MITQANLGELVAQLFDRLPEEFPNHQIQDAMILVELHGMPLVKSTLWTSGSLGSRRFHPTRKVLPGPQPTGATAVPIIGVRSRATPLLRSA